MYLRYALHRTYATLYIVHEIDVERSVSTITHVERRVYLRYEIDVERSVSTITQLERHRTRDGCRAYSVSTITH